MHKTRATEIAAQSFWPAYSINMLLRTAGWAQMDKCRAVEKKEMRQAGYLFTLFAWNKFRFFQVLRFMHWIFCVQGGNVINVLRNTNCDFTANLIERFINKWLPLCQQSPESQKLITLFDCSITHDRDFHAHNCCLK